MPVFRPRPSHCAHLQFRVDQLHNSSGMLMFRAHVLLKRFPFCLIILQSCKSMSHALNCEHILIIQVTWCTIKVQEKDAGFHTVPEKCHFPNLVSVRARSRRCPSMLGQRPTEQLFPLHHEKFVTSRASSPSIASRASTPSLHTVSVRQSCPFEEAENGV